MAGQFQDRRLETWVIKRLIGPLLTVLDILGWKPVLGFLAVTLLFTASEGLGVSLLYPVLSFVESGRSAFDSPDTPAVLKAIVRAMDIVRLPLNLLTLLSLAIVPMLARVAISAIRLVYVSALAAGAQARLRGAGAEAILEADLQFINNHSQGELISRVINDGSNVSSLTTAVLSLVGQLLLVAVYVLVMFLISVPLATVALLFLLVAAIGVRPIIGLSRKYGGELSQANSDMVSALVSGLQGIRVVKLHCQERAEIANAMEILERLRSLLVKTVKLQAMAAALPEAFFLGVLFLIVFIAVEVFGLSLAALGLLGVMLWRSMPVLQAVNNNRQKIGTVWPFVENLQRTIVTAKAAQEAIGGGKHFSALTSGIEFDEVDFAYSMDGHEERVLHQVSFTIPKNTMLGIVGRSGAGKSTLADLIPRLREVDGGEIRFDGVPQREFDVSSLRRSIGVVSQETFLFNGSVYQNIAYGVPDATEESVTRAAKKAYAHDFIIHLPERYDSLVGDRGVRLSAGQRQRIGIARVMLQSPQIVLMDEPTSALDSESEQYIQASLEELRDHATIIVIAHRLSTIRNADQIIVFENGRIIERGTHECLLERNGSYRRLFDLQLAAN